MAYENEPLRTASGDTPASELAGPDLTELARAASDFARENPHAAIGGAFAAGFLLGGGLTPRLLASIAMLAGRRYLSRAATEVLEGAIGRQVEEILDAPPHPAERADASRPT